MHPVQFVGQANSWPVPFVARCSCVLLAAIQEGQNAAELGTHVLSFHVVWSRYPRLAHYLAYRPEQFARVSDMLACVSEGAGHCAIHSLVVSPKEDGFMCDAGGGTVSLFCSSLLALF